jgi:hypothetical protein
MKVRRDFVTNSSSSSFLIAKKHLDSDQIKAIRNHSELGEKLGINYFEESWWIRENDGYITGSTSMDNFDMEEFLEKIDVNMNKVDWSEWGFDLPDEDETEYTNDKIDWRDLLYED